MKERKYALVLKKDVENNHELLNSSVSNSIDDMRTLEDGEVYLVPLDVVDGSIPRKVIKYPIFSEAEVRKIIQDGTALEKAKYRNVAKDVDQTGRQVVRYAATMKGWHYQAHSVQLEVNKLGSIYNKDHAGVDLGYAELKIYDVNGVECTTQESADTDGVKTVVTWKPDFDFEIISGNIRQDSKETADSYIYVNARIPTGHPPPFDTLVVPFVQGGVNLKYIGADEPLKTDGRASKLMSASTKGEYFEVIVNYEANLLNNENRHKMSLVFEIYKDPLS